jgi:hypothetical protein
VGGGSGEPLLPYRMVRLVMPPDADRAAVQAELVNCLWRELPGRHDLAPARPAATWGEDGLPQLAKEVGDSRGGAGFRAPG